MSVLYITPHFSWLEMQCHDGTPVPIEAQPNMRRLCYTVLEPVRARWGEPIVITCGYRTPHYNQMLRLAGHGAALNSKHMTAEAADVHPVSLGALPRFIALVEQMIAEGSLPTLGGFGIYPQWVHLDVREKPADGHIARWTGAGVASEP